MSHFLQHREFFDKPIYLSEEEQRDPIQVIEAFYGDYNLSEVREIHSQIDQICLSTDSPPFNDPERRDMLITFRRLEERVLEAALLLLCQTRPEAKPSPSKNAVEPPKKHLAKEIDLDDLQSRVSDINLKIAELTSVVVEAWASAHLKRSALI